MYRWVRQRHMMGLRGRNFLEAPWAGGVVLLVCVIAAMLLANLPATKLYYHHLLETDLADGPFAGRGDRLDLPAGHDRREVHQRRADGDFLLCRGSRDQARDRLRSALVRTPGHPSCAGGRGRHAGSCDILHGVQPRYDGRKRLGNPHRHGHRLRHRHPLDAGQPGSRVAQKSSSRRWPSPTTWGPSWSSRSSTGARCRSAACWWRWSSCWGSTS